MQHIPSQDSSWGHCRALASWVAGDRLRGGCRKRNASSYLCPLFPQLLVGQTDASLRMRKLWRFLPDLCRHPVLHKPCATLLFLLGGYNEKNLNMVCVPLYPSCCHPKRRSPQAFCTCTACPQKTCYTSWQCKEAPQPCQSN